MPGFDPAAAERFLATTARVLERRLHARLFADGPASGVRDAVAAYRTPDGGFGFGLEPDARSPHAHPAAISTALRILHEADAWDDDLARAACDWLWRHAPGDHAPPSGSPSAPPPAHDDLGPGAGGATFVDPGVEGWPRAPWFGPEPGLPRSPVQAGPITGLLVAHDVAHPWRDATEALLWDEIDAWIAAAPDHALTGIPRIGRGYELRGLLAFLEHADDERRAHAAIDGLASHVAASVSVAVGGDEEAHRPLHLAPAPTARAARLFAHGVLDAHVDALAAGQRDDGGWTFDWMAWSPAAAADWRGALTVDALRVLRLHGRW
ncbi:MAG: hypothetical protein M0P31_10020 [Solirubrobacteraceae bacterium]|nr:hypothetical protein [Solirubrobacteraceae bacterium]